MRARLVPFGLALVVACGGAPAAAPTVAVADPPPPPPSDEVVVRVPVSDAMPVRGPADAAVTIVMFSDFECPFCARVWPTMERVFERYPGDVRLVFRHNPLAFHTHAALAGEAAMEAHAQGGDDGFFRMADLLFQQREHLEPADLEGYAAVVGLDVERFRVAMAGRVHRASIESDAAAASALGATGTPSFFINGSNVRGAQPFEVFDAAVAVALHSAHLRIAAGVPAAGVYDDVLRYATAGSVAREPAAAAAAADPPVHFDPPIPPDAPSRGPGNAPVTLVIYSDFQCPFCTRILPTLDEIERRYVGRVRIVWRDCPLPFHVHAMLAHEAAREAYVQAGDTGFWAMHDLLYENQAQLAEGAALFERLAASIGLDLGRFRAALASHIHRPAIEAEMRVVSDAGLSLGTPTSFINGEEVRGAQPIEVFVEVIDRHLATP